MSLLTEIRNPIEQELAQFEKIFDESLISPNPLLMEAIRHLKKSNGKMMRPILVLLFAKLYGDIRPEALHSAVSLELLHTASLVHDDVVDESDERRGQLSVNAIFNNKVSVLVGDFLLATSLVQVSKSRDFAVVDVVSRLGQLLADGEILQLSNVSNKEFSIDVYYDVISKKTAALFAACSCVGALSSKASQEDVDKAIEFGRLLGICFQIRDDIFDYYDSADIGKPTGNDMLEGKLTLPALYVLNNKSTDELVAVAHRVKEGDASLEEIGVFINEIVRLGGIDYAEDVMKDFRNQALDILSQFPESASRQALRTYLDYVVLRNK